MGIAGVLVKGALAVSQPVSDFSSSRKEGHGMARSLAWAAVDTALWFNPVTAPIMVAKMGFDMTKMAVEVGTQIGRHNASTMNRAYTSRFGGNFEESQTAYTMRQRGVQALQNSGGNVRSVLGSEARSYYRNSGYR